MQVLMETQDVGQVTSEAGIPTRHSTICLLHNTSKSARTLTIPVIAGVRRQGGARLVEFPFVVTRALRQGHAAAVEQVETRGAVAAVVAGGGALHLRGGHVQTHARTRAAVSLALCRRHVRHAMWTHT